MAMVLMETTSAGSMYELQDVVDFNGGKLDTDTLTAKSNVTSVSRGPVEKIYIETGVKHIHHRYRSI